MDRKSLVRRAKIAEASERWQDMKDAVIKIPDVTDFLVDDERNLFNVAFRHLMGTRRASLRVIRALIERAEAEAEPQWMRDERLRVKEEIEADMKLLCAQLLDVVTKKILTENLVYFLKLAGDYHRYLTDVETGDVRAAQIRAAAQKYEQASKLAGSDLPCTHPLRLGLALNYSVFFYETKREPEQALKLANAAFNEAVLELDELEGESYRDTTLMLQLLRDNLVMWGRKLG